MAIIPHAGAQNVTPRAPDRGYRHADFENPVGGAYVNGGKHINGGEITADAEDDGVFGFDLNILTDTRSRTRFKAPGSIPCRGGAVVLVGIEELAGTGTLSNKVDAQKPARMNWSFCRC